MKLHRTDPSRPDRARCGTVVADAVRLVDDPARVTCRRCARAEPADAQRFGLLRYALEAAVLEAPWLTVADRATVQLARHLADQLDRGHLETDEATAVARQLGNLYRALGLSPDGRGEAPAPLAEDGSPLAELRGSKPRPLRAVDG